MQGKSNMNKLHQPINKVDPIPIGCWLVLGVVIFICFCILSHLTDFILNIFCTGHIKAKIEKVEPLNNCGLEVTSSPCNVAYVPPQNSIRRYTGGVVQFTIKNQSHFQTGIGIYESQYFLLCQGKGNVYSNTFERYRYRAYRYPKESPMYGWIVCRGKSLRLLFENGVSMTLSPFENKTYYHCRSDKVASIYLLTPEIIELLKKYNIIEISMEDAFCQKEHIRKKTKEELNERFELIDKKLAEYY